MYLDRSLAPGGGGGDSDEVQTVLHDFVPEGCPAPAALRVHLLYRPGHYVSLLPPCRLRAASAWVGRVGFGGALAGKLPTQAPTTLHCDQKGRRVGRP